MCTVTAGLQKVFSTNPAIGFLAHARGSATPLADGQGAGAGEDAWREMCRVVFNDYVDATLAGGVRGTWW